MKQQILMFIAVWVVALSGLVLYLNRGNQITVRVAENSDSFSNTTPAAPPPTPLPKYQCEGKRRCSQMNSCEEALFYLQNCPGIIMDGDNDNIPCENQLCEENGKFNYSTVQGIASEESTYSSSSPLPTEPPVVSTDSSSSPPSAPPKYQCLGKVYCSEMTSCEEATFYLQNCPGTKMDGNNDGIPCEKQWCRD